MRKEKKWKRKKKKKRKVKYRRSIWWVKRKEQISSFFALERKEEEVKEKSRKRNKSPRAKQLLGRLGRWLFLLFSLMQNWFCVGAAAGRLEPKGRAEVLENETVNLDGGCLQKEGEGKAPEKVEADKRS